MLTLRQLGGDAASGVVLRLHTDGVFRERLQGLGVCPGNRITLVRSGAPIIFEVCGGRVAIAPELADFVEIELSAAEREGGDAP